MRRILAVAVVALGATGCPSIPEPVSDDTPPLVGMTIEYKTPEGRGVSEIIGVDDSPKTVDVKGTERISILFSINDNEGARTVTLVPEMYRSTGMTTETSVMQGDTLTSSRPRRFLSKAHVFEPPGSWTLRVHARGENWLGMQASTPQVTFRPR